MALLPLNTIQHLSPPDINQAKQFLSCLDPTANDFLFVAIKEGLAPQVTRQPLVDPVFQSLAHWNSQQSNIYVTINETNNGKGTSRKNDEITKFRCVYIDDDGDRVAKDYPIEPSAVIETSPGKKQVYWFLSESPNKSEWDGVQQTLVNDYGGDPNARDAARILRVPGLYNVKKEYDRPVLCHTIKLKPLYYSWNEIKVAFPISQVISVTGKIQGEALDLRSTLEQFITGVNYHTAGMSLVGYFHNKGIKDSGELITMLQSLIDIQGDPSDARFHQRRNIDIPANVGWIMKERKKEETPEILDVFKYETSDKGTEYTILPNPGGGMFQVVQWIKSIMRYPNDTVAVIVAEHLVSVFGGGHYHIMNNTTTRKRIMLAPLGSGKNTISRAMSLITTALESVGPGGIPYCLQARLFEGSDSFTFAVQHKQLEEHRVRSFIVNEAGEAGKSTAGDISTLRAYQLQALSTKADESFMPKKFSEQGKGGADKQLNPVYNGVWVYLHESTLSSYADLLKNSNAFINGDLSRSDIFFINPRINKTNRSCGRVTDLMLQFFSNLANDLRRIPGQKGSENHSVWKEVDTDEIRDDLIQVEDSIVKKRNSAYARNDETLIALLGRKFERIITSVLICATADAAMGAEMVAPVARKHHLEYALKRAEAIDLSLKHHADKGGALSDDSYKQAEVQFIEKFKILIVRKDRREKYGVKRNEIKTRWVFTPPAFNYLMQNGAFKILRKSTFNDELIRARSTFIEHLAGLGIVHYRKYTDKGGVERYISNEWELSSGMFPVK